MVATVIGGEEAVGLLGVANDGVEIDNGVEVAGGADPLINSYAVGFAERAGVVVIRAGVGSDGGSDDAEGVGVGAGDNLRVGGENALDEGGVPGRGDFGEAGEAADVVDAFKNDEPADAGGGEDIAIEAGEDVGAEAVGE